MNENSVTILKVDEVKGVRDQQLVDMTSFHWERPQNTTL